MEKIDSKKCSRCKELKPFSEFHIDNSRKDGHVYWCKSCTREYQVSRKGERREWADQYYLRNRETVLKKQSDYRLRDIPEYNKNGEKVIIETEIKY